MANTANSEVVVSTPNSTAASAAAAAIIPAGITDSTLLAMSPANLLETADKFGQSVFNIVRLAAIKAVRDTVIEVDAGTTLTAQARADMVVEQFSTTLNGLSQTNRSNIRSWFASALVVLYAPQALQIQTGAVRKDGATVPVLVPVTEAVNLPKNKLVDAAKQVRTAEGTARASGGGRTSTKPAAPAAPAPAPAAAPTAEQLGQVVFYATLERKLGTAEGMAEVNKHLMKLGFIVSAYEAPADEPATDIDPDVAIAEKEAAKVSRNRKPK